MAASNSRGQSVVELMILTAVLFTFVYGFGVFAIQSRDVFKKTQLSRSLK